MALISFSQSEFLDRLIPGKQLDFLEGMEVTFSDVSFSKSSTENPINVFKELGRIFGENRICFSFVHPNAIQVDNLSPLRFRVIKSFELFCATSHNWMTPPFNRIGFRNISDIHHVHIISRGGSSRPILPLDPAPCAEIIESIVYQSHDQTSRTFLEMLIKTHTDAIVILKDGKLLYEKYFDGQEVNAPHIQFSITKSLTGIIVAKLIHDGTINPEDCVKTHIPELENSGFADARIIDLLDMTSGLKFNEDYADPNSDVTQLFTAASYFGDSEEMSLRLFLTTIKKEGEHGHILHYVTANTEVLSWLVEKIAQKTVLELFTDLIWSNLESEHDAVIIKDKLGDASWGAGFAATTRDMARIGQMILNAGKVGDKQLLPSQTFQNLCMRDTRPQFKQSIYMQTNPDKKDWSYTNQFWWTHNEHNSFMGIGIFGQLLYIDPKARMVIAKNSSHTEALGKWLTDDALEAIRSLCNYTGF